MSCGSALPGGKKQALRGLCGCDSGPLVHEALSPALGLAVLLARQGWQIWKRFWLPLPGPVATRHVYMLFLSDAAWGNLICLFALEKLHIKAGHCLIIGCRALSLF